MALRDLLRDAAKATTASAVSAVNAYLTRRATLPSLRNAAVWHPSELCGGVCVRQIVLMRRNNLSWPTEGHDLELDRIFDVGHALHRVYQEDYLGPAGALWGTWKCSRCERTTEGLMPTTSCPACQWLPVGSAKDLTPHKCATLCGSKPEKSVESIRPVRAAQAARGGCIACASWGKWRYIEPPVKIPSHNIEGKCDGLLVNTRGEPDTVLEIKTANDRSFGARKVTGPSAANLKQVMIYMHALKKTRGVILYVNKNNGEVCEFEITYDLAVIEKELGDALQLEKLLAPGVDDDPPPKLAECVSPRSPRAKACPACSLCME